MEPTTFTVLNIDGLAVGTYDVATWGDVATAYAMAKQACYDLAREAAASGDTTNGYSILDDAEFEGHLATEFDTTGMG